MLLVTFGYSVSSEGKTIEDTIEEMKEAVTKVIDTLTQEDFRGAFQKLLNGSRAFQPEEITSKGTRVSCVYYQ